VRPAGVSDLASSQAVPAPMSQRLRPPAADIPAFTEFLADLADRGELRPLYAALCAVYWVTAVRGQPQATVRDVRDVYPCRPPRGAPRLAAPGDQLGYALEVGFLSRADDATGSPVASSAPRPAYRLTALGRAVVESLPDLDRVSALRGLGRAVPGARRARADGARTGAA
jgi:hypothetical protein